MHTARRSCSINVRLTEADYQQLRLLACDVSDSEFVRQIIHERLTQATLHDEIACLKTIIVEGFAAQGVAPESLRQIVAHAESLKS